LVSPKCLGYNIIWYMPPNQNVNDNTIRASFGKNAIKREFASALIYRLQKRGGSESNTDTSTGDTFSSQLLIIWRSDSVYELSVGVKLIKHDNTMTLDANRLKKLDYPSLTLLKNGCRTRNMLSLDGTTMLMTNSVWKEHIRTIEIIISSHTGQPHSSSDM
jgi:hypothetical protein